MPVAILNQEVEMVSPADVETHPDNPRQGDLKALVDSFRTNGFYGTVVVQKSTRYVLAGNHRVLAARKARMKKIPVMWVDVDDELAKRILVADNRMSDLATYNTESLAGLLEVLAGTEVGLQGLGYTETDLNALLEELAANTEAQMEGDAGANEADSSEEASGATGGDTGEGAGPDQHVRQVQLFYNADTINPFLEKINDLRARWGLDTITDIVTRAVENAHEQTSGA